MLQEIVNLSSRRTRSVWLVVSLAILMSVVAASNGFAQVVTTSYTPSAYGTYAFVGNTALVGQTAPVALAGNCGTSQLPLTANGTAAAVNVPLLVSAGAANTSVSDDFQTATSHADTVSLSLLGGLISAQDITAVSTTTTDEYGNFHLSAAGSSFRNLVILGRSYNSNIAPNTRVNLPLLGYVMLNEQTSHIDDVNGSMTVNMVHVYVTVGNLLGLPIGTQVIVSSATSGIYNLYVPGIISGFSFGSQVSGGIVSSTPTAYEVLPCQGTNGVVQTASQVNVTVPGILTAGTLVDTVESNLTYTGSSGENTSTIQGLNVLSGLVTATVMRAQVDASIDQYFNWYLTGDDTFVGLSVLGHPELTDAIPMNTSVPIAGLGTLYLKRRLYTPFPNPTLEVRSVELVVNQINVYGLPIGLDVIVGDALITLIQPYPIS